MSKIIVVADDLTGANATSILLKKNGYESTTFLDIEVYDRESNRELDVVSISTDSRAIDSELAYEKVDRVVKSFRDEDVEFYAKRIDSTLRGNIGSEVKAVLDNLNGDTVAMVLPSYPGSKRVVIGNHMLVDGVPLSRTSVAKDPKTPVYSSSVYNILKKDYQDPIGIIYLDTVEGGIAEIEREINLLFKKGIRMISFDAITDLDIENIAIAIDNTGLDIVSVDPGPLTQALARQRFKDKAFNEKIMLTIGSVTDVTVKQVEAFKREEKVYFEKVDAEKLIYESTRHLEIERASQIILSKMEDYNLFGVISTKEKERLLDLGQIGREIGLDEDGVSNRISSGLAEISKKVMDKKGKEISGLYTSGGDITVEVCKVLGAVGIRMIDEVMPLAVYGKLKDGCFHGLSIVTKGGLIGDDRAIIDCIDFLRRR